MAMKQRNTIWRDDLGFLRDWVIYSILVMACVGSWAIPLVGFIAYDVVNDYPVFLSKYYITYIGPYADESSVGYLGEDNRYNLNHFYHRTYFGPCSLHIDCPTLEVGKEYIVFGSGKIDGCQALGAYRCVSTYSWVVKP